MHRPSGSLAGTANQLILANAILWPACLVAFAMILWGTAESSPVTALLGPVASRAC